MSWRLLFFKEKNSCQRGMTLSFFKKKDLCQIYFDTVHLLYAYGMVVGETELVLNF